MKKTYSLRLTMSAGYLKSQFVTCLIVLFLCAAVHPAQGQGEGQSEIGGFKPTLPIVPKQNPRPGEGPNADQRWQIQRRPNDNGPTAAFVDSLRANDSTFHVVVGQGRLLTTRRPIAAEEGVAMIAVGDPSVVDFDVLPNPRMIRVTGKRAGVTDLSLTTADGQAYSFEVHVGYDLVLLSAQLRQVFPGAKLNLRQLREHLIVEGQARDPAQVSQIIQTIENYLASVQVPQSRRGSQGAGRGMTRGRDAPSDPNGTDEDASEGQIVVGEDAGRPSVQGSYAVPQVINLIAVPGVQQVMLKVQIAELDRTGLREIGTDIFAAGAHATVGSQISNAVAALTGYGLGLDTTAFGLFNNGDFQIFLKALRENGLVTILAEPNLVTMSGQEASFLAGGEFPISVPQGTGAGNTITVEFKDFGVQLDFLPVVLDDEVIRLTVAPEVSTIDEELGVTLVPGGEPVPGVNTRRMRTTVEMRQGQTLAVAGLLQVESGSITSRIPGLGDLPYLGALFSDTTHRRQEKELLVMVTPMLVSAQHLENPPPLPGTEVQDPNDWEFYMLNRIEGRTDVPFRSTTSWDRMQRHIYRHELNSVYGPAGFSDCR